MFYFYGTIAMFCIFANELYFLRQNFSNIAKLALHLVCKFAIVKTEKVQFMHISKYFNFGLQRRFRVDDRQNTELHGNFKLPAIIASGTC